MPIWVTLITGFLGSGKTTLLNALLKDPALTDAVVIVNEFGEVGVDADLMMGSSENVVQLANGCLCCSVKGELIDTFRDLTIQRQAGTVPKFNRVIIETTGIADPGPVLQIILTNPMVRNNYALDGIVTTLDAINGLTSLANFPESVRQVAVADRIVLTKSDMTNAKERLAMAQLRTEVRKLNPAAPIIEAVKGKLDPKQLFGLGIFDADTGRPDLERWIDAQAYEADEIQPHTIDGGEALDASQVAATYAKQGHQSADADGHVHHHHGSDIRSFCMTRDDPVSLDTLRLFLEAIARESGPNLLRVKGLIHVSERPDHPAVIQGAQQIFHSLEWLPEWPSADRRTRIVFITRGIERSHIEDAFVLIERIAKRTALAAGRA